MASLSRLLNGNEEEHALTVDQESTNARLTTEKQFLLRALRQLNEAQMVTGPSTSSLREGSKDFRSNTIDSGTTVFAAISPPDSTLLCDSGERGPSGWSAYSRWIEQHDALKSRLEQVNALLQDVEELFETSENHASTGYRGFSGWAKKAFDQYAPMCDSISAASVFGAGITYTTVFSASRGNVGLMCWAFALFDVGFIISLFVRSSLLWCSRLPALESDQQRSKPSSLFSKDRYKLFLRIGDIFLLFVMFLAFATQAIAVFLLNVTLLQLSDAEDNPELTMSPVPSAVLSLSTGALGVLVSSGILVAHWMTHGLKHAKKRGIVETEELFL
ncbi:hypothetical protein HYDPIDRAFT_107793 [Hydnomerulius pinastri MD-312]|nr:hypothetical protein HYDPIDRAFT_107793 [Hydnomerulius pinastri MD-312]